MATFRIGLASCDHEIRQALFIGGVAVSFAFAEFPAEPDQHDFPPTTITFLFLWFTHTLLFALCFAPSFCFQKSGLLTVALVVAPAQNQRFLEQIRPASSSSMQSRRHIHNLVRIHRHVSRPDPRPPPSCVVSGRPKRLGLRRGLDENRSPREVPDSLRGQSRGGSLLCALGAEV